MAAYSGDVKGRVYDRDTKDGLPGANIVVVGTSLGAASDVNGNYVIRGVPLGSYTLSVSYVGYKKTTTKIVIKEGEVLQQDVYLEPTTLTGEEVIVTAQAHGQMQAINQQLSSNTIANVVSADRIRDIPDANAAESIGRLPGISIIRSGGEGQKVTIRGMAPQYNIMMLNGVRLESTDRNNRSVDLNMISPNMLSGIEVKKALTADMDADAVGGTVNLRIGKAKEEWHSSFSVQGGYGSLANTYGNYRINGLISDRYFDDKLGMQATGFLDKYNRSFDRSSAGYFTNAQSEIQNGLLKMFLNDVSISDNVTDRKRVGGSLVLDYRLPFGSLMLNNFISSINDHAVVQQNNLTVTNYNWSGFATDNEFTNTVIGNALQGEFEFSGIKMDLSLSNSITKQRNPGDLRMEIGPRTGGQNMWGDSLKDDLSVTPSELLNAYYVNSGATVIMQRLYTLKRDVDETAQSAVLNFQVPFNFADYLAGNLKFGGKYIRNTRKNDETQWGLSLNSDIAGVTFVPILKTNWPDLGIGDDNAIYASFFGDPNYDIGNFLAGKEGISNRVFYNKLSISKMRRLEDLAKNTYFVSSLDGQSYPYYFFNAQASTQYDYEFTRHFGAFYVMAELNLGTYITLLPGMRYERYQYIYDADSTFERATQTVLGAQAYDYKTIHWDSTKVGTWFPQIQLRVKPTDWLDLRFASTRSIIYPDYRAVSPYLYFSSAASPQFLQIGNPYLSPAITQNYDIYLSVYNNTVGLFTAGFFYKKIDNLIVPIEFLTRDASKIHNRMPLAYSVDTQIRTWINLEKPSYVRGVELDWQTHFWYLPSFLNGLVLNVNYTHIKSESYYPFQKSVKVGLFGSKLVDTTRSGRLIDQPNDILNLTLGYDIGGFSARLSFLYQDNVLTSADIKQEELDQYTGAYYRWDFTAYQKLPWLEGLQLYLNVNNITDRPDRQYRSVLEKLSDVQYYGRTADLGVRYSF
ncbi:MAG: TonB-dependent receptor [Ignavibacteriales bacterium]|nr:TonB-dependent receptor [Ignavibacteriales bacterium]